MAPDNAAQTPGQLLRRARLERGHDLDAAHEGTKIPLRLLEAIERDEYHQLSDGLYVKSFLRNYATWLGLEPAPVLALYDQIAGRPDAMAAGAAGGMVWTEDKVAVTHIGVPWLRYILLGLGGLALLLFLIWFFAFRSPRSAPTPSTPPPVEAAEAETPAAALTPPPEPLPTVRAELPTPRTEETAAERLQRLDRDSLAIYPADTPGRRPAPAAASAELRSAVRGDPGRRFHGGEVFDLVLRVFLPQEANCSVKRDGQAAAAPVIWREEPLALPAYNLRHGEVYAVLGGYAAYWGANDHFTLILDNLQGAEVTLNGVQQPVDRWRPGQPVVLDRAALAAGGD
jgi:cytoskeletal protein RodZ